MSEIKGRLVSESRIKGRVQSPSMLKGLLTIPPSILPPAYSGEYEFTPSSESQVLVETDNIVGCL